MNQHLSQSVEPANTSERVLIERAEICRRLKISNPTFFRMVGVGRLSARKIGGRWKMRPEALDDFIDGKTNTGGAGTESEKQSGE